MNDLLVEHNDIFARHHLNIGVNNDIKIKLTHKTDYPTYTQSLPCPVNLKDDLTLELFIDVLLRSCLST